jgi:hypothetical protein
MMPDEEPEKLRVICAVHCAQISHLLSHLHTAQALSPRHPELYTYTHHQPSWNAEIERGTQFLVH